MSKRKKIVWMLVGLIILFSLLTGVTQIRPGERAVVYRFGRALEIQPRPGLWIGLPWGMERVEKVAVDQVRQVTVGYQPEYDQSQDATPPGQFLTGDNNLVTVQIVVNYNVDPDDLVAFVRERARIEPILEQATESALADHISGQAIDNLLLRGSGEVSQAVLAGAGKRIADYKLGIQLQSATVTHLQPPAQVKAAFDKVTQARSEMSMLVNEAEQDAERKWSDAQAEKYRQEKEADTYVFEVKKLAKAEAAAFERRLAEYQKNPGVLQTGRWEYLVEMLKILKENGDVQPLDPGMKPQKLLLSSP